MRLGPLIYIAILTLGSVTILFSATPQPVAAAANGYIFFIRGVSEVWRMNANGSNQTLIFTESNIVTDLEVSPDGTKLAYSGLLDGSDYDIYVRDVNGSNKVALTVNTTGDFGPSWSPNGQEIIFVAARDGNNEIYKMNADGTAQTRLTNNAASDRDPYWSPAGSEIVFRSTRDNANNNLYSMSIDGTNVTRLTTHASGDTYPYWSPDGSKIVFLRTGTVEDVFIMNRDGTGQAQLTTGADTWNVKFSPDGSKILYTRRIGSYYQIHSMNTDGTSQTRLTNLSNNDYTVTWQPIGGAATQVNATLAAVISLTTNGTVTLNATPDAAGVLSVASDTVTVNTNNSGGYTLSLANGDGTTSLVDGSNTITAHTGTFASPTTFTANRWGYRIDGAGGFGAGPTSAVSNVANAHTWAGVPASGSPQTLKTTASTASNDVTTVWYGVFVDSATPSGAYSDTVTYTAVTN